MRKRKCEAAHVEDRRPCSSWPVVVILDGRDGRATGCERHAVTLVATLRQPIVLPLHPYTTDSEILVKRIIAGAKQLGPFYFTDPPVTDAS